MEIHIPIYVSRNMYDSVTVEQWQIVWDKVCRMAYHGEDICDKIITRPGNMNIGGKPVKDARQSTHSQYYAKGEPLNNYFLTLENIWRQYSTFHGPMHPKVIPELKELVVPHALFDCLGVQAWFMHSFPNCKIFYWDE